MDSGGLFIGTSKLLLALMNSAPAELLHPLNYAALQPYRLHENDRPVCRSNSQTPHRRGRRPPFRQIRVETTKKNAGNYASVGISFPLTMRFCKEKAASPDIVGLSGSNRSDRFGLFIKLGDRLSVFIGSIRVWFIRRSTLCACTLICTFAFCAFYITV
jgi:hypothetical protein